MRSKLNLLKKHALIFFAFLVLATAVVPLQAVSASPADEIRERIKQEEEKLAKTQKELSDAEKKLAGLEGELNSVQGELPRLELEIEKLETQIAYNKLQMQILAESEQVTKLVKQDQETVRKQLLQSAYSNWKLQADVNRFMPVAEGVNSLKEVHYQTRLISGQNNTISELQANIEELVADIEDFRENTVGLEKRNKELKEKKKEVLAQIAAIRGSVDSAVGVVAGLQSNRQSIEQEISQLNARQKAIEEEEARKTEESNQSNQQVEIASGEFYFESYGRDLYQGHGVGMSQYGAKGMAAAGKQAEEIVTFYFKNTTIGTTNSSVNVQGYGSMSADDYVAGLGEVPDKACGTTAQAAENPAKYVPDNPNTIWDCWPEEAIKAQVIAARTYAVDYNRRYGRAICTTAACQVYAGGNGKRWAAQETAGKVILYNGQVIEALYSSDNNQGFGTANNDTRWSNFSGDGTAVPYLRHVNDTAYSQGPYTNFRAVTDGFKMGDVKKMLHYRDPSSSLNGNGAYTFFNGILSEVGNIANLEFARDPSQRVKKVVVVGENGARRTIAGWLFKSAWNDWVYGTKAANQRDYIYSQTFFMRQKN